MVGIYTEEAHFNTDRPAIEAAVPQGIYSSFKRVTINFVVGSIG